MVFGLSFYLFGFGSFFVSPLKISDTVGDTLGDTLRFSPLNLTNFVLFFLSISSLSSFSAFKTSDTSDDTLVDTVSF